MRDNAGDGLVTVGGINLATGEMISRQDFDHGDPLQIPCCRRDRANELLAAKDARIRKLEAQFDAHDELLHQVIDDRDNYRKRVETLEAQLAAAKKALEPFAEIAGEPWADENGWTEAACQNDRIKDWFGPSAFLAARQALAGKEGR